MTDTVEARILLTPLRTVEMNATIQNDRDRALLPSQHKSIFNFLIPLKACVIEGHLGDSSTIKFCLLTGNCSCWQLLYLHSMTSNRWPKSYKEERLLSSIMTWINIMWLVIGTPAFSVFLAVFCLSICLSVCLFVCMSVCLIIWLSACLSVCLSVCLCLCLSV